MDNVHLGLLKGRAVERNIFHPLVHSPQSARPSCVPSGVARAHILGLSFTASQEAYQEAGSEPEPLELNPAP